MKKIPRNNITPYQLKMPLEISKIIEISDPVYTFCEVMDHIYIDGTKLVANANKYSWVWKKSSVKNRQKTFRKVTDLLSDPEVKIRFYFTGNCSVRQWQTAASR